MPRPPDKSFPLRFPVAQDRTLRRIGIMRLFASANIIVGLPSIGICFHLSEPYYEQWDKYGEMDTSSPFFWLGALLILVVAVSIVGLFILGIVEGTMMTRRYGWRAVSDPIEAQRVATREALYDVGTGSARAMPETEGKRVIVIPTRRLRPTAARLELMAEREPAKPQPSN